tara:strand:+ start:1545 stop:2633 length:1089 start_codon:yes stop_codon:yes gene_type:complete
MAGNSFGKRLKLTTFGESHGAAIGGILDGLPAGLAIDLEAVQQEMARRKPGQSEITTKRNEDDAVEILSGVFEGKTTGTSLAFIIKNKDQRSKDYSHIKDVYRPSHADYVYDAKYGNRDYRGGGRSSARETACRVAAGAIVQQFLAHFNIEVIAYVSQVGTVKCEKPYKALDLSKVESNIVRCPDAETAEKMIEAIKEVQHVGDTVGGVVTAVIKGTPVGLGEPVFDKLHAALGSAMLGINAVKGFEYGIGFEGVALRGSEHNDPFEVEEGTIKTSANRSGGIQGGISNGEDIYFNVAFKPVATLMQHQETINSEGDIVKMHGKGRHDPCVVPRAVPIVEAMAALVIADYFLMAQTDKMEQF